MPTLDVVAWIERSTKLAGDTDRLNKLLRDRPHAHFIRRCARENVRRLRAVHGHRLEHLAALIAPVAEHRIRHDVAVESLLRIGHPDQREALGVQVRQRCVEHALHNREDREAAAEADGERQADRRCKGALPEQGTD